MKIAVAALPLLLYIFLQANGGSAYLLDRNCGVSVASRRIRGRMVGGQNADIHGNPWMVMVVSNSSFCGGSLITSRFVLTAAHCVHNSPIRVRLGEYNMDSVKDCTSAGCLPKAFEVGVDQKYVHPKYATIYAYDIALLRLASEVQYSEYIRPICVLVNQGRDRPVSTYTVTGWGSTGESSPSKQLQTATLNNLNRQYCALRYKTQCNASHICAGSTNSDACNGDSGGPLSSNMNYDGAARVFQFGIVSYGSQYCRSVGVYTNVEYVPWIVTTIQRSRRSRRHS
ncbi:hypothetical protein KR009_010452 [Drosophila setifemur]|nr:hypothetical protein KR009_010452 [Drosophila setifemur]